MDRLTIVKKGPIDQNFQMDKKYLQKEFETDLTHCLTYESNSATGERSHVVFYGCPLES